LRDEERSVAGRRWYARVSADPVPAGTPPVVLVHGLGVSSRYMVPTARCLAPHFPTLAPDLPGFGRSQRPDRVLDVPGLADALAGWMRARALPPAVLLANSLGCQVAVDLALRHPDLVGWLLLAGPTGDPAVRGLPHYAWRLLRDFPRESPTLVLVEIWDYLRAGPQRVIGTAQAMLRDSVVAKLPLVRQPTVVVRGERDPICPQAWAEEAVRRLPRGRLVVVPGAAHVVNYSAPRVLLREVCALVEAAPPPAHTGSPEEGR
jgi:pimeloyl-ACP methyl ester carboxylesterase